MEKGGNGNSDSESLYKDLSARYESLLREDMKMWGTKEEKRLDPEQPVKVIATTYFPEFDPKNKEGSDSVRGALALESIARLNEKGIDVSIVDGGSSPLFKQMIGEISPSGSDTIADLISFLEMKKENRKKGKKMPGRIWFLDQKKKGYSQARIEAIKNVTDIVDESKEGGSTENKGAFIQVEIEKVQLVDEIFNITRPINEGKADIVVPDRGIRVKALGDKYDDFRNYPEFQAVSERKANLEIHRMLVEAGLRKRNDSVLDLFGGTRAFKNTFELKSVFGQTFEVPEDSHFWGKVKPEAYSNAVYYPIYIALTLNKKVKSVPIEFSYSQEQSELEKKQDEEFALKRKRQFDDIVTGSDLLIDFLGKERIKKRIMGRKNTIEDILWRLKEVSILKLDELKWTDRNEFNESWFYKGAKSPLFTRELINDNNVIEYLDEALYSYFSKFNTRTGNYTWEEFEKIKETLSLLKSEAEERGKMKEVEEVYKEYQKYVAGYLMYMTHVFYVLRESNSSRNLDFASFFAKFVEVPAYDYINAVLSSTPNEGMKREFDSLTESFGVPEDEKIEMLYRFARERFQEAILSKDKNRLKKVKEGSIEFLGLSFEEVEKIEKEVWSENKKHNT